MPTMKERPLRLVTPLGDDVLLLREFNANEHLSRPFVHQLELLSENGEIDANDIVGQPVEVSVLLPDGTTERHFHGFVTHFSQTGEDGRFHTYRAELRPWLWFLTRSSDCRIFRPDMKIPQIIEQVFGDYDIAEFENQLTSQYREWEYIVQYRESDFNFVSRLMEREGIYYYFKHEQGKHIMVLADSKSAHSTAPGYDTVRYIQPDRDSMREVDHLDQWSSQHQVQSGAYALNAFNFKTPTTDLEARKLGEQSAQHSHGEYEVYDYPGDYGVLGDAEHYTTARIEELQAGTQVFSGAGNVRGLAAGALFTLENHPRKDMNREYLLLGTQLHVRSDQFESSGHGSGGSSFDISVRASAIDASVPYRPPRVTPTPRIRGPQTAIVVTPTKGDEIWCDEYGRVKVQFHWDRYGKMDADSSCWIRVATTWAGQQWGAVHIPRKGQEVIVDHLEGDPDRPIIVGSVYNFDNKPPYTLPEHKTQSGVKSRSSTEGTPANFNEIRFEDAIGKEQIWVHAEKDRDIVVKNNETKEVGNDRTKHIVNNETTYVDKFRTETVGEDETITIIGNRIEKVEKNEDITITKNRDEKVGGNETVSITKDRVVDIGKTETLTVKKARTQTIGADETVKIDGQRTTTIKKKDVLKVNKELVIDVKDQITIKTGKAQIVMKKDGTIDISGKDITIKGSGKINVKASKDIVMKGSKILQN